MEKMTSSIAQTAGVDISKDHLDVCLYPHGAAKRFANDAAGFAALHAWLAPHAPTRVVFEATGAYHRAFERALGSRGLPMVKVNPRQARAHAEALGKRAKTDRVDAAMLARLGVLLEPPVRPMTGAVLDQMKELHVARRALDPRIASPRRTARTTSPSPCSSVKPRGASMKSTSNLPPSTPNSTASSKPMPVSRRASKALSASLAPPTDFFFPSGRNPLE
jgi:hypothetical protein